LISLRGEQANFQLVVITHEERLVDYLALNYRPDVVSKVSKNLKGHTVIKQSKNMEEFGDQED
jgi:hypothetical protein